MKVVRSKWLIAGLLAFCAMLASSSEALASYDPIATGAATLRLDPSFKRLLEKNRFELSGRAGARIDGTKTRLPVDGGKADPTIRKTEIEAGGELVIRGNGQAVAVKHISLFTKPTPLIAKLGGGQLKLARAGGVRLEREGFGSGLIAKGLKLTAKAAMRLDKRLHTDVFHEGEALGTLRAATQPQSLAVLAEDSARIDFDPGFFAKLKADSTSVNPIFPAEHAGLAYTLPMAAGGRISPEGTWGTLRLAGNLELLRLGGGQIFWNEPWLDLAASSLSADLDLEPAPTFAGALGRSPIVEASLGGPPSLVASDPTTRTLMLSGVPLRLDAASADQFNKAFAEGAAHYQAGELLGTLSVTVQTQ